MLDGWQFPMNKIRSHFQTEPLKWLPLRTHFVAFALTLMALMLNLFRIDSASCLDEATSVKSADWTYLTDSGRSRR